MAAVDVIAITKNEADLTFIQKLCLEHDFNYHSTSKLPSANSQIVEARIPIVFLDGDNPSFTQVFRGTLEKLIKPKRVFVITENPIQKVHHLHTGNAFFGHHMTRKFDENSMSMIARLMQASLLNHTAGLEIFFPGKTKTQKLTIKEPAHKHAAVNAIEKFFQKREVPSRLATLVATGMDELMLNSIYVAPRLTDTKQFQVQGQGNEVYPEIIQKKGITVETASSDEYVGLMVADPFGTLSTRKVFELLTLNNRTSATVAKSGLGIKGTFNSGLSLIFMCKPKFESEIAIFFPRTENYRQFKGSFQFLSFYNF